MTATSSTKNVSSPQRSTHKSVTTKKKQHGSTSSSRHDAKVHDATTDPTQRLIERRLFSARKTKRVDLSAAAMPSAQTPPALQIFPRQICVHEHMSGHHLREIWLTNHHISILPSEIGHFPELRVLGLGGNGLATLPPEIAQLTTLESLYLERNELRGIPEGVEFPRHLRNLRLDHNALSSFPIHITRLRLLNRLGLSHNRMTTLPREIRRLANLVELDLDHNRITTDGFPNDSFVNLQRLERLGLEGNQLNGRPPCLNQMPSVLYVRLNGNRRPDAANEGSASATRVEMTAPRRHDGYYQCVEGYQAQKVTPGMAGVAAQYPDEPLAAPLRGLLPTRHQNWINAQTYYAPPSSVLL